MRRPRLAIVAFLVLMGLPADAPPALAAEAVVAAPAVVASGPVAATCVRPGPEGLRLAAGVILCCCADSVAKGQCCNYVADGVCGKTIPGCACQ